MLAIRWSCSKRFFGRNERKEYFVVRILLILYVFKSSLSSWLSVKEGTTVLFFWIQSLFKQRRNRLSKRVMSVFLQCMYLQLDDLSSKSNLHRTILQSYIEFCAHLFLKNGTDGSRQLNISSAVSDRRKKHKELRGVRSPVWCYWPCHSSTVINMVKVQVLQPAWQEGGGTIIHSEITINFLKAVSKCN